MILAGLAFATEAFAQDSGGAGGVTGLLNLGNPMYLMIAMLAIFYFLLIRPQQKRQKEHKQMLTNLQKGDTIFTTGGLRGKITSLDEAVITLEIADRVRVKVNRSAVGGLVSKGEAAPEPPKEG
jgi:preprotein translocase subunit YajC